eukprot:gene389-57854_t
MAQVELDMVQQYLTAFADREYVLEKVIVDSETEVVYQRLRITTVAQLCDYMKAPAVRSVRGPPSPMHPSPPPRAPPAALVLLRRAGAVGGGVGG